MNKLIKNIFVITGFAVVAFSAAFAFFNDTEGSSGNKFEAGSLNLKIDSECYIQGEPCEGFGNWDLTDLTAEKFFNFGGLMAGDQGENTISYHVYDNDAYGCFSITPCDTTACEELVAEPLSGGGGGGGGNCAQNDGYECYFKDESWTDNDTTKTFTSPGGEIITVVYIKAGTNCLKFTSDTTSGYYLVSGIGTDTVTVTENFPGYCNPHCPKDVSHTEFVYDCETCPPDLWIFGWHDDGDNIFEPGESEEKLFDPTKSSDFDANSIYTLADPNSGPIIASNTSYIGLSWCATATMDVNYETGEITCEGNHICAEDVVCLDVGFEIEQARHNSNFSCAVD